MTIEDIRKKHLEQKTHPNWGCSSALTVQDVDALFAALDAERGKVKTVVAYAEDVLIGSDHDYAGKRIIDILTGEG